jgi:hypothetical protein
MHRLFEKIYGLLLMAVMFFVVSSAVVAQSYYGTLKGSVLDQQGAAIAGATVTLTDVSTRIKRTAVSNGAGEYVFSAVDPSTFDLSVTAANFQAWTRKGIVVATQQTVAIDTKLMIGEASQTVEVSAAEPLIDTSTASNGQVFDTQKLVDLPNLGRNPFLLTKLNTNVTAVGDPRFNRFQDQSGSSAISVSGGPINGNNYEIDGVPITDFSNRAVIIPSVDAVQEMKIQTNTYDAEMGRTGGGNFNTLLKSGSNTLHGNLLGTTRQTNWSSNTWNNNYNGTGRPNITQYTYEGSIGGPVRIPKIYNGKDKTFFWLTEEGYRQRSPLANNYYLPTAAERSGDFSARGVVTNGVCVSGRCIYDPATTDANGNRTPFANNIIPASRISTVGQNLLVGIPSCGAGCTQATTYGSTNFRPTDLLGDRADEFIGKIDHQVTRWWSANVSYMHYGSKEPGGDPLGSFAGDTNSYLLYRKVDATTVNSVITINPTTVATVGWGFNRFPNNTLDLTNNYDQSQLGLPSSYVAGLQKKSFPRLTLSQIGMQVGTNNSGPAVFYSRNFVAGISKSMGKQAIKFGYVYRTISVDFTNVSNGNGFFTFNNTFTSQNANSTTTKTSTGADLADMLLGYPTTGQVQIASRIALNVPYHAFYVQDDYRLTSRLTINAGLRYEYEPGIHERSNHYAVGFDPNVTNPIANTSGVPTKGGIMFAGQSYPTNCCSNSNTKFAPRIGAVYALDDKSVIRGGYGIFYAPIYYSTSASFAPGYVSTTSYVASNNSNNTPANSLSNPYPSGLLQPVGNTLGLTQGLGDSLTTIDQGRRSPVVQQYSLDIERQFPYDIALQLGYVGSKGKNLLPGNGTTYNIDQVNYNNIPYGVGTCPTNPTGLTPAAFLAKSSANPYYQKGGIGVIASANVANAQLCKPFPEFSSVNVQPSSANSLYNSLIIKAQKKMAHGLDFLVAYTWSANWDSNFGTTSSLNSGQNGPQDVYSMSREYARAINNIPQRFTFGGTYQLPFGRGRTFLSSNRWVDLAVGGWNVNTTFVGQSGGPIAVKMNTNGNSNAGSGSQRPNLTGVSPCTSGTVQQRIGQGGKQLYLNPAAFSDPGNGVSGNAPRTLGGCSAPAYRNVDASIFKDFRVERFTMQFRGEFMNLLNTPQFSIPSGNLALGATSFGQVSTNAINFPRLITLGGKIFF